jgi:lambda family phage portal protein
MQKTPNNLADAAQRAELTARIAKAKAEAAHARLASKITAEQTKVLASTTATSGYRAVDAARSGNGNQRGMAVRSRDINSLLSKATRRDLRGLSRDALRNNVLARGIIEKAIAIDVGTGLRLQSKSKNTAFRDEVERLWAKWWKYEADIAGRIGGPKLESVIEMAAVTDGDIGIMLSETGHIQIIESDRIDERGAVKIDPAHRVVDGVEVDPYGRIVAYHVQVAGPNPTVPVSTRVNAPYFLLFAKRQSPWQVRGEPRMACMLDSIDQLDRLIRATITAAELQTILPVITHSESPRAMAAAMPLAEVNRTDTGRTNQTEQVDMGPMQAHILHAKQGDKVTLPGPTHPHQNLVPFIRQVLRMLSSAMHMPLEVAMLDMSEANFSSAQMALRLADEMVRQNRQDRADAILRPIFLWKVQQWMADGTLRMVDDWDAHEWQHPKEIGSDRYTEVQAAVMAINANLSTRDHELRRQGMDRAEVYAQRAFEKSEEARLGIQPPMDPGTAIPGQARPQPVEAEEDQDDSN